MSDEPTIEFSTPFGKLAAHGVRVSDIIGLLTLLGVLGFGVLGWKILDAGASQRSEILRSIDNQRQDIVNSNAALLLATNNLSVAQRMTTCIISLPQDKREAQFIQPNSLCRRMSER